MNQDGTVVEKEYKPVFMIWMAMVASLFAYSAVIFVVRPEADVAAEPIMGYLFAFMSATTFGAAIVMRKIMAKRGSDTKQTAENYKRAVVVAAALAEAVGLFGVVLHFLGGSLPIVFAFLSASLICMLFIRPKLPEMSELLSESLRSSSGL